MGYLGHDPELWGDTVEALFTSGVISMAVNACRILSILAVIAVKNPGLALVLLFALPLLAAFTRHVQRRMLAAQLDNLQAVAAISGQVPEALHNICSAENLCCEGVFLLLRRAFCPLPGRGRAVYSKTTGNDDIQKWNLGSSIMNCVCARVHGKK